jgi:acetyl-CoA carboxylase/biotin carboxylase 1
MEAKGVIREVVDWARSRLFFCRRLCRRIAECSLIKDVIDAAGEQLLHKSAMDMIKTWFLNSDIAKGREDAWMDDEAFFAWKDDSGNYEAKLQELRAHKVLLQLTNIGESQSDLKALPQGLAALLSKVKSSYILCFALVLFLWSSPEVMLYYIYAGGAIKQRTIG